MAARGPFWKWCRWKSIGFCLWPPSTCIWNFKLKFQSKLDLCSGNHVVYRQTDGRTDGRTRWIQYTPPPTGLLSIRPQGEYFNEILIKIKTFSFKKIHLKVLSAKSRPFCLGFDVLHVLGNCVCCWVHTTRHRALIQYKDVILPAYEIPLWR